MLFRNEAIGSRAIRHPDMRGCPACLREDAKRRVQNPLSQMAMRGDWQLRHTGVCLTHGRPLVTLWSEPKPSKRFDFASQFESLLPGLLAGELEPCRVVITDYDRWLDQRLEDGTDGTWLSNLPLNTAATLCRMLGAVMLGRHIRSSARCETTLDREASSIGFQIAKRGRRAIKAELKCVGRAGYRAGRGPKGSFKSLYDWFSLELESRDGIEGLQELLLGVILDIWPIDKGESLFGLKVPERKLHNLSSASVESGVRAEILSEALVARRLLKTGGPSNSKETFSARELAPIVEDIQSLVTRRLMRLTMNATEPQFEALVSSKLLKPALNPAKVKCPWRPSDGTAFIEELSVRAVAIAQDNNDWLQIHDAARRSGQSIASLVERVRSGNCSVACREGFEGYAGLCVPKAVVYGLKAPMPPSLGAFAKSVGIQHRSAFERLVVDGHTPATKLKNPVTGATRWYVTETDAAEFLEKFFTIATLASERDVHRNTVRAELRKTDIKPFKSKKKDYGNIYLRSSLNEDMVPWAGAAKPDCHLSSEARRTPRFTLVPRRI